jgi:hypothetical protein
MYDDSLKREGKSQNSAVQNLFFNDEKKNRPTVGTGADRWQIKKKNYHNILC